MAKRGQGVGTIAKRYDKDGNWDGTWWARITIGRDESGKQKRKAFYGKTKKEVQDKMIEALNDINKNAYIEQSNITFSQWLDIWMKEYRKDKVRASTFCQNSYTIKKHVKPFLGQFKLKDLRNDMIQAFVNNFSKDRYTVASIRKYYNIVHAALKQAYLNKLILNNPADHTVLPPLDKKEKKVLSPDEQKSFIKSAKQIEYGNLFIFILCTGLRIGEALALTWNDVDFEKETVNINKTYTIASVSGEGKEQRWGVGPVKTKASNRNIPLLPEAVILLKEQLKEQEENALVYGQGYNDNGVIFCTNNGSLMPSKLMRTRLKKILVRAGLPTDVGFTPHSLRHTFATRALENGVEMRIVQDILGHANMNITANLYTHVLPSVKRESIMKLRTTIQL